MIFPAGIRHASRLLALDQLREGYYQILIRLHMRNHDRSSAIRVWYHQCLRNLQRRELGVVSPSKETQDLFKQALSNRKLCPQSPGRAPAISCDKAVTDGGPKGRVGAPSSIVGTAHPRVCRVSPWSSEIRG